MIWSANSLQIPYSSRTPLVRVSKGNSEIYCCRNQAMHSRTNSAKKRKPTNGENKLTQKRLKINRPICGTSACNATVQAYPNMGCTTRKHKNLLLNKLRCDCI